MASKKQQQLQKNNASLLKREIIPVSLFIFQQCLAYLYLRKNKTHMFKKILLSVLVIIAALFLFISFGRKNLHISKDKIKAAYRLPNSHFIKWNNGEIHYTESGSGFPILMIHGFGGSNYDFLKLDSLINDKYRVIRVDLPGFGMSDFPTDLLKEKNYAEIYKEYFNFLIDTLHLDSMYIMGNSLGGMMAWNVTVNHPKNVKKLILFNSAGYDMKDVIKSANADVFTHAWVRVMLRNGLPMYFTTRGVGRVFYNKESITETQRIRMNALWNRDGNLDHLMSMASSDKYVNESLIKTITCPTLIIWGKQDIVVAPKYAGYFHRDIKNSRVIMYDSCGHVPMVENPLQVKEDVLKFLSEN